MATQGKLRYLLMSVAKQGALLPFGHGAKREQSRASVHADLYLALSLIYGSISGTGQVFVRRPKSESQCRHPREVTEVSDA